MIAPLRVVSRVVEWGVALPAIARHAQAQVPSDVAIAARVDLAPAARRPLTGSETRDA